MGDGEGRPPRSRPLPNMRCGPRAERVVEPHTALSATEVPPRSQSIRELVGGQYVFFGCWPPDSPQLKEGALFYASSFAISAARIGAPISTKSRCASRSSR